LNLFKNVII